MYGWMDAWMDAMKLCVQTAPKTGHKFVFYHCTKRESLLYIVKLLIVRKDARDYDKATHHLLKNSVRNRNTFDSYDLMYLFVIYSESSESKIYLLFSTVSVSNV